MKNIFTFFAVVVFIIISTPTKASHFNGAHLSYEHLSGTSYRISYTQYRDCSGVPSAATISVTFVCDSNSALNFTGTLTPVPGTGQEVTPNCSAFQTTCNGGIGLGLQEFVYQATVNLPPCNEWQMHHSSGSRNIATNLTGTSNYYIPAFLKNQGLVNSSPEFSTFEYFTLINNHTYKIPFGGIDPDGDSLVYSLYTPMSTALTNPINYQWPYSISNFLNSSTPITLNSETGILELTPSTNMSAWMGVKIEEWRKINGIDTRVGVVYRDYKLLVNSGYSSLPLLSGIDTTSVPSYKATDTVYNISTCPNLPLQFYINGYDPDTFNSSNFGSPEKFSISLVDGINGASFQTFANGTDSAYASFSWTPTNSNVSSKPHCFNVKIEDEACPYHSLQQFRYCIRVGAPDVQLASDTVACLGDSIELGAIGNSLMTHYAWYIDNQFLQTTSLNSVHLGLSGISQGSHMAKVVSSHSSSSSCAAEDSLLFEVRSLPSIFLGDDTLIPYTSSITLPGPNPNYIMNYLWNNGDTLQSLTVDSTYGVWKKEIWLIVTDSFGCKNSDTIIIYFGTVDIDYLEDNQLSIYPVPFNNNLTVTQTNLRITHLQLYSIEGKLIREIILQSSNESIDFSELPSGIYILKTDSGLQRKIVKL